MSSKSSKSEVDDSLPDTVLVGRVRKPHGVRGEVAVEILSDVSDRFAVGADLLAVAQDGSPGKPVCIAAVRCTSGAAILRFEGYETREEAESLRGVGLEIPTDKVPVAPVGSYYFFELIGCVCEDVREGKLGVVVRILEDGGGLVLEIERAGGTVLVPFVESYLKLLDPKARRIEVDLPEGLIETCTSRF